jgi:transcriptional regulator with PAS, ATPase and Fis domain
MPDNMQIFESINMGLVVLDHDLTVQAWNSWMHHHSGIAEKKILGGNLLEFFPNLAVPKYKRLIMSVFSFGNYAYFSQKLHRYLFTMKNPHPSADIIPYMQQSCTAGPIRNEQSKIISIYITVQDVTENVTSEIKLREKIIQLEQALARVKQLEGVIRICMYCKQIRTDKESWQQIEAYISAHSEALFSHGICPDCYAKQLWLKSE